MTIHYTHSFIKSYNIIFCIIIVLLLFVCVKMNGNEDRLTRLQQLACSNNSLEVEETDADNTG